MCATLENLKSLSSSNTPLSFTNPLLSQFPTVLLQAPFTTTFHVAIVCYFISWCFLSELGYNFVNTETISQLRDPQRPSLGIPLPHGVRYNTMKRTGPQPSKPQVPAIFRYYNS